MLESSVVGYIILKEAPVPKGGPLCRKVFCAERIGRGPCVGGRPSVLVGPVICAERI